jgi:hypothetical protein
MGQGDEREEREYHGHDPPHGSRMVAVRSRERLKKSREAPLLLPFSRQARSRPFVLLVVVLLGSQ